MKRFRNLLFYVSTIIGFSALMIFVIKRGELMESVKNVTRVSDPNSASLERFVESLLHNVTYPLAILLLQIMAIIIVARVLGYFFRKIGQPSVIGEIIAGIVLGPSVAGLY